MHLVYPDIKYNSKIRFCSEWDKGKKQGKDLKEKDDFSKNLFQRFKKGNMGV